MGINIKKQVTSFLLLTVMLWCICPVVSAAELINVSVDSQTQKIEVEGTLEYGINNRLLAITVEEKENDGYVHINQVDVAFDGTYSYAFPFEGELGEYTVKIHCGDVYAEADFSFGSEEQILEAINRADTAEELLSCLEQFRITLNFDNPTYKDRLNDEQKLQVLDNLCDIDFGALDEINIGLAKLSFDMALANAGIWQNTEAILRENATLLELDFTDFDRVKNPEKVLKLFLKGVTSENAKSVFDDAVEDALKDNDKKPSRPSSGGGGGGGFTGTVSGTISVQAPVAAPEKFVTGFKDLEDVSWAKDAVSYLEEKGIVAGMSEGKFEPMAPVSRAQFVKMLSIAFDFYDENITSSFTDVPEDAWFNAYVGSAAAKGVVLGRADGSFGPNDSITRQDMAVFAYRCAQYNNAGAVAAGFADEAEIASYARDAVSALSSIGILNGTGGGMFMPTATATRAQAAKIIYELIQYMNK